MILGKDIGICLGIFRDNVRERELHYEINYRDIKFVIVLLIFFYVRFILLFIYSYKGNDLFMRLWHRNLDSLKLYRFLVPPRLQERPYRKT